MFSIYLVPLVVLCGLLTSSSAQEWTTYPFHPPALPLAVKSPSVNIWCPQGSYYTQASQQWPQTSSMNITGWNANVRVDGKAFVLLGSPPNLDTTYFAHANQTSVLFTPTRTSYLFQAGPVDVNMTLLSPIEAQNITRLSTPFIYMYFTATPNDNDVHDVQFYVDQAGEWISGDYSLNSNIASIVNPDFIYLEMSLQSPRKFNELSDRLMDGKLYHCMKMRQGISWAIDNADVSRNMFGNGTGLQNNTDKLSHPIESPWDTLGISVDIGSIRPGEESDVVVHAIGVVRNPAIQLMNKDFQLENRKPYYWAQYSRFQDIIEDVLNSFDAILEASIGFDNKLLADANNISSEYAGIVSLATRQAMNAIEYVYDDDSNSIMAFLNNTGRIGSGQLNAVDVIYSAMPIYIYLNPNITGYLLKPLLELQSNAQGVTNTKDYAAVDLGTFPNATGVVNDVPNEGIEQSANMIILCLVHAKTSGDGRLLTQYYDLLKKWGNYLVDNVMSTKSTGQSSSLSDGVSITNQTNLMLKGVIGIQAMSEISSLVGQSSDADQFKSSADEYYRTWESMAVTNENIVLAPEGTGSGLIYNLYADKILDLNLVKPSIYELQTSFYRSKAESGYGIPIDYSDVTTSRTDWMLFAASAASDPSVRNAMISQVYQYAASNSTNIPFPVVYNPESGSMLSGIDSPAQGALFAPLALNVEKKVVTVSPVVPDSGSSSGDGSRKHQSTGVIVGSIVAAVTLIVILVFCVFLFRRWRRNEPLGMYNRGILDRMRHKNPVVTEVSPMLQLTHSSNRWRENHPGSMGPSAENNVYNDIVPIPFSTLVTQATEIPTHVSGKVATGNDPQNISTLGASSPRDQYERANGEEVLREVNNLRMEIERLREEGARQNLPPPSYYSER